MFTRKIIAFGNGNEDGVLDVVLLHEVTNVRDMSLQNEIMADDESEIDGTVSSNDDVTRRQNMLEIETHPEGYNSGRIYRIRAASANDFRIILDNLARLSVMARDEADAKSKFKKSQQRVGEIFNSNIIQRIIALLILGVRNIQRFSQDILCSILVDNMACIFNRIFLST